MDHSRITIRVAINFRSRIMFSFLSRCVPDIFFARDSHRASIMGITHRGRRGEGVSSPSQSCVDGVGVTHKRSANSEEIAFPPRLTQLFVTFAPLKRVSRKLSSLLSLGVRKQRARVRVKRIIVGITIPDSNRGNSTSSPRICIGLLARLRDAIP